MTEKIKNIHIAFVKQYPDEIFEAYTVGRPVCGDFKSCEDCEFEEGEGCFMQRKFIWTLIEELYPEKML